MAVMMWWLQGEGPFLPTSLQGWLQVISAIAGGIVVIGGTVWALARKEITRGDAALAAQLEQLAKSHSADKETFTNMLNGMGGRIATAKDELKGLTGRFDEASRSHSRMEMEMRQFSSSLGRQEGEVAKLTEMLYETERRRTEEVSALREEVRVGFAEIRTLMEMAYDLPRKPNNRRE